MTSAIKIENLSKKYIIGHQRQSHYNTLRDLLVHNARNLGQRIRHPLSFNRETMEQEELWALRNINLEIEQGDRVGIIGRNGAGKSTLLKVLSRITEPTEGRFTMNGRAASLLEVGTGFHPELTGRENIFLNGAILGMTKADIKRKFDEIVAFAETEKFLDTPVKRYSSGMYVRLAFAVAAHLEPEILIVDEVLAVGDGAFQKKCLGKMKEVGSTGRTVLFVSHNLAAVNNLCDKAILIDYGRVTAIGSTKDVTDQHIKMGSQSERNTAIANSSNSEAIRSNGHCNELDITEVSIGVDGQEAHTGGKLHVFIRYRGKKQCISPAFVVSIKNNLGLEIIRLSTMPISGYEINKLHTQGVAELLIYSLPLVAGMYSLDIGFVRESVEWLVKLEDVLTFPVLPHDVYNSGFALDSSRGLVVVNHTWNHRPS